ncbi:cytochrome-c peroxidase [Aliikangiella coralliicola]|uniref:C-type cytochrome n=1 Tax=Aliikangiella coralliicola TaxID=2592383 RepID=A0A545UEB1_9GAMM|nr:cytochrome c peroxidase [Aliikangiella coralliicola]TQV87812.1 c-type cytochrome [Aliikangiella coralliicola]
MMLALKIIPFVLVKLKKTVPNSLSYVLTITFSILLLSACSGESDVENQATKQQSSKGELKSTSFDKSLYLFTESDIRFLQRFSLSQLGPPPDSISNKFANDEQAAMLGKKLFFDVGLSRDKKTSCATCHAPELYFTDGLKLSKAAGVTARSAPTVLGAAYSPWQFWDGRKDSLWSQALGPIEDANEMNTTRVEYVRLLLTKYAAEYQAVFKEKLSDEVVREKLSLLPASASPLGTEEEKILWHQISEPVQVWVNQTFSNAGKAMMAYQRRLELPRSRFDQFVDILSQAELSQAKLNQAELNQAELSQADQSGSLTALTEVLTPEEVTGLRLFVGKANCASCHNGPLLTNFEFHNIGAPDRPGLDVELGRYSGVKALVEDEFTCLSRWSDAPPDACEEMRFLKKSGPELVGALKTPTLRNIAMTAPYMQTGQFDNLRQVLIHYNQPTPPVYNREQHPSRPHFDILPLKLTEQEMQALESFLKTLTSPLPKKDHWWGLEPFNSES